MSGQSSSGQNRGSRAVRYRLTTIEDEDGEKINSISAMAAYKDKSHQELRWEDYQRGDKGVSAQTSTQTASNTTASIGTQNTTASGFTGFGQQVSPFGVQMSGQSSSGQNQGGSRAVRYRPTTIEDEDGEKINSISAMAAYKDKSHQELRWEDYQRGDKGVSAQTSTQTASNTTASFGTQNTTASGFTGFGQEVSPFGVQMSVERDSVLVTEQAVIPPTSIPPGPIPPEQAPILHYLTTIVVIGGILVGYTLAFSGGLFSMPHFLLRFSEKLFIEIQKSVLTDFCIFTDHLLIQFTVMIASCAVPSIWASFFVAHRLGHRCVLLAAGVFWILGAVICIAYPSTGWAFLGMALLGVGTGAAYQSIPSVCYQAPAEQRGRASLLFYYMIPAGAALAYVINFIASYFLVWGWRVSYSPIILFAVVFIWIVYRLDLTPPAGADEPSSITDQAGDLFSLRSRPKLIINVVSQIVTPLTGVRTLVFFGPRILESLGYTTHQSFLGPLVVGVVGLCAASASTYMLRRWGRLYPLLASAAVVFIGQLSLGELFRIAGINVHHHLSHSEAILFVTFTMMSIVGYYVIAAPHGWTADAYHGRGSPIGDALENTVALVMVIILAHAAPGFFCHSGPLSFVFMAPVSVCIGILIALFVPETTDTAVEDMPGIWSQHFFWSRYFPAAE